jgi:hypothetical protein
LTAPLSIAIPVAGVAFLLEQFLRAESLVEFFLQALLLTLLYYLLAWIFVLEKSVKESIESRLRGLLGK